MKEIMDMIVGGMFWLLPNPVDEMLTEIFVVADFVETELLTSWVWPVSVVPTYQDDPPPPVGKYSPWTWPGSVIAFV